MKTIKLYFSHDRNALNDVKIMRLIKKWGGFGYGLYWAIIERLHDEPEILIKDLVEILYLKNFGDEDTLSKCIDDCITYNLFQKKDENLYCERVMKNLEDMETKRKRYSAGGKKTQELLRNKGL